MAELTGMTLLKNGIPVNQMLNFGAPRIGDKTYAAFADAKMPNKYRHTHTRDIVPHSPPSDWPFSFY
jgi:predicted lipase